MEIPKATLKPAEKAAKLKAKKIIQEISQMIVTKQGEQVKKVVQPAGGNE